MSAHASNWSLPDDMRIMVWPTVWRDDRGDLRKLGASLNVCTFFASTRGLNTARPPPNRSLKWVCRLGRSNFAERKLAALRAQRCS
jgi:hypothetical protein